MAYKINFYSIGNNKKMAKYNKLQIIHMNYYAGIFC